MTDFEHTCAEYESMVRRLLLRLCGNTPLAEELTQETFYQALRNWKEFHSESNVSTWLCTIAKRLCLNLCRRPSSFRLDDGGAQAFARSA